MALLEVDRLEVDFPSRQRQGKPNSALAGVNFTIETGETLAVVGESGAGKSTLARAILRLVEPSAGRIHFRGNELTASSPRALSDLRRRIGFVMQDSTSALNPKRSVLASVMAPLVGRPGIGRPERLRMANQALEKVGLDTDIGARNPAQLSGGQRQRVSLARAIVAKPELLICDEPLAGLDLVTETSMLEVLRQATRSAACLFITHDFFAAAALADDIAVMEKGRIIEKGPVREVLSRPKSSHTRELINAIPPPDPDPAWQGRLGIADQGALSASAR